MLLDTSKLPKHVAIIMDGNGRWAKKRRAVRTFGHESAITAVEDVITASAELGIRYLTLFAFSTENWQRPRQEVSTLMHLLVQTVEKQLPKLIDNRICLRCIGDLSTLPMGVQSSLNDAVKHTQDSLSLIHI